MSWSSGDVINTTANMNNLGVKADTYTIWINGSYYQAVDGTGKIAFGGSGNAGGATGTICSDVINAATQALASGGVVRLREGTFLGDYIQLLDNTTFEGCGQGVTTLKVEGAPTYQRLLSIDGKSNVTVRGLTLNGNAKDSNLLYMTGTIADINVVDCTFTNGALSAVKSYVTGADTAKRIHVDRNRFVDMVTPNTYDVVSISGSVGWTDSTVNHNLFKAASPYTRYAVHLAYTSDTEVCNNIIDGTGAGIQLWTYTTTKIGNNIISGNIIRDTVITDDLHWAILSCGDHTVISGNVIDNPARDAIVASNWYSAESTTITGNTVTSVPTPRVAIWVHGNTGGAFDNVYNVAVTGNTIVDTGHGIVITYVTRGTVTGNIVDTATDEGIQLAHSTNITVANNRYEACTTPLDASTAVTCVYDGLLQSEQVQINGATTIPVMTFATPVYLVKARLQYSTAVANDTNVTVGYARDGAADPDAFVTSVTSGTGNIWATEELTLASNTVTAGDTVTFSQDGSGGAGEYVRLILEYITGV